MTPRALLAKAPARFAFDAAIRILLHAARTADPGAAARFVSPPNLAYPAAEITATEAAPGRPIVQTAVIGMTGPAGVLPRSYTEAVTQAERNRAPSLHAFLDMIAERFVAAYALAGGKYRIARAAEGAMLAGTPEPFGDVLLALTGYGTSGLGARLEAGAAALQHYAGFFAAHPRSADRLGALASDWLGRAVRVRQFAGAWLALPPDQRTALPTGRDEGAFCRLGRDAAAGVRAWDAQARAVLVVGPLSRADFEALLPGGAALSRFVSLVRAFLGYETGFAVNLVLQRDAVPPLRLETAAAPAPRLGWNTWLTAPAGCRLHDPADPLFEAHVVEAASAAAAAA
jgi:type VI secretion system protein ImpH